MCGIIGVISLGLKKDEVKAEIMRFLFTELLQATENRGKDATGISALFTDGMSYIQKGPLTATEFIENLGNCETSYNTFMKNCVDYTSNKDTSLKLLIGHCRKSTVGGAFDNVNNHPIKVNEIIGVHNGTLDNHNKIFTNIGCKRDGIVDSEAIMHLLDYYTNYCTEPFTIEGLEETARRLEGAYSVIAYNANNPYQLCIMRKERPFELVLLKELGIILIASEKSFFLEALLQYNKIAYLFKSNFKPITISETEIFTLPTDNIGILNLTKEVEKDDVIENFLIRKDIFKTPKIWKMPSKNTVYNKPYVLIDQNVDKKPQTKGKDTNNTNHPTTDTTAFKGKIFSKKFNMYVTEDNVETTKNEGPVAICSSSGKIQNIDKNKLNDFVEDTTQVNKVEPVIMNEVETVDNFLFSAMEASIEYNNFRSRFDTDEEIIDTFNIKNVDTLNNIPTFALINKVKETIYKEAFVDGASWYKENNTEAAINSTKAVRISKQIIEIFGNVIEHLTEGKTEIFYDTLRAEVKKKNSTELTLENIRKIFSKGDTLSCQALKTLEVTI